MLGRLPGVLMGVGPSRNLSQGKGHQCGLLGVATQLPAQPEVSGTSEWPLEEAESSHGHLGHSALFWAPWVTPLQLLSLSLSFLPIPSIHRSDLFYLPIHQLGCRRPLTPLRILVGKLSTLRLALCSPILHPHGHLLQGAPGVHLGSQTPLRTCSSQYPA